MKLHEPDIVKIQKFKGQLDGEYSTIWVATDKNGDTFLTHNFELKQTLDGPANNYEATEWQKISTERYNQITNQTHEVSKDKMKKEVTFTENIEYFRRFVVETVNSPSEEGKKIFDKWHSLISNPAIAAEMAQYFERATKGGISSLFTNKENALKETLIKMYRINYAGLVNQQMADRITSDPKFHKYLVEFEAKNLLSGTTIYSTEIAAAEAKTLRDKIEHVELRLEETRKQHQQVTENFNVISKKLSNLISNVKSAFSATDDQIKQFQERPAEGEKIEHKKDNKNNLRI